MTSESQWYFFVPGIPIAQPRSRAVYTRNQPRMYTPDNGIVKWKRSIQFIARQNWHGRAMPDAFYVGLEIVFPRPKSMIWKTKPMPTVWHIKKPDRDNLDKAVLDALTGIFWIDDCQACDGRIKKRIAGGGEECGVYVLVHKLTEEELR